MTVAALMLPFTLQLFAVVVPAVARLSWLYEDATVWFWFRIKLV